MNRKTIGIIKNVFKGLLEFGNGVHVCFSRLAIPLIWAIYIDVSIIEYSPLPGIILLFSVLSILYYFYPRSYKYE